MHIKRWIVLSLAAVLTTLMLTGCPWDKEEDPGSSSSSSSSSSRPDDGGGDDGGDPDPIFYTVTASIGEGGTVTMDGTTIESGCYPVQEGAVLTFTVLPEKGWQIKGVTANESPLTGTNGAYTYTVKGDCTIAVTFQKLTYTITATVSGTGGMASVDSASVEYGDTANVTITPDAYYKIDSVQDNDTAISVAEPDEVFTYTIQNITENHAITVTFVSTIDPTDPSTWRVENGTLIVPAAATELPEDIGAFVKSNPNITGIDLSQSGVTAIDSGAFYECYNLKSVTLGNVTSIGDSAFAYSGLQSVTLGNVASIGDSAFAYSGLQSVTLGNVASIGDSAFAYSGLQSVTLGNVTSIGERAFLNCGNLQMVVTGDVDTIGEEAFNGCFNLHTVVMGDVGYIGASAFHTCDRLARIRLGSMPEVGYDAFFAATDSIEIYIGGLKEEDKATVKGWFSDPDKVSILEDDPYDAWVGGGNALAQYLTRLF